MTKVLVAGASGYLGRFVARAFKEHGDWVRVLTRNREKLKTPGPFLEPAIHDLVDDVFVGEVTRPETLRGLCEDIEVIFSSIGITRQPDRLTYMQVDYQGNKNLLDQALEASVRKFIFVHSFHAFLLQFLDGIRAKQKFVDELRTAPIAHAVICPTGFFNDMTEFLRMAKRGTVYLIGDGQKKINPIHGADLATVCVEAMRSGQPETSVGGPGTFTYREIAELAFDVLNKPPSIRPVPVWLARYAAKLIRPFSRKYFTLAAGLTTIAINDFVASPFGCHTLKDYYQKIARQL